jgi:thiamine-phosphate pyrophosphorylase
VPRRPTRDPRLSGLYLILDPQATRGRPLTEIFLEAVAGGARLFQYRDKQASMRDAYRHALELRRLAAEHGALFLVNDRCDLALAVEADGVHLGQRDLPVAKARALLGPTRIIGLSTHGPAEVVAAPADVVDYLGFGPIYSTETKPDHEPVVGLAGLRQVRSLTALPIFAIGGITAKGVEELKRAGADGVAVISAVCSAADVAAAVREFTTPWLATGESGLR